MTFGAVMLSAACGVAGAQMNGQPQPQTTQPGMHQPGMQQPAAAQDIMGAQQNAAAMSGMMRANGMNARDKSFLKTAAAGGLFEVKAGQLASDKAQSDAVKQFGQMMVQDHTKLNNDMAPFLEQAHEKVPTELKGKEAKEYAKLQGLSGAAFDKAYVQLMVKDHQKDLAEFKQEAMQTQQPDLKSAVMQGEQVIQTHLEKVQQIQSSMGSAGATNGSGAMGSNS